MPVVNTVACAVCGRQKQEANHWFIVYGYRWQFVSETFKPERYDELMERFPTALVEVVCGAEHVQVAISRWLEKAQP